ncbi:MULTISPECIES: DUF6644 family protein [Pacificibacter]|uniref:DUF6644 family protein n=1 Tax=Pacificibacter TaxID=1042323 RepID=UPI001C078B79|nr:MULTISPECIES: DUF6644 family protein [Pacificibacter]MBU2869066.1 hypothetical protein [Pacificibacter marinus]MBU2936792.1 hypothetical protein [Pacificibacter marinus]MDO6614784.1 hypothetical protein [Pacificibacter sp. 1_MG-2023]
MNTLLNWVIDTLNSTALSGFIMTNAYLFPFLEMAHFIGLCLLFGSLIVVDLRVVGFAKSVPIARVDLFVRFALIGFAINLMSGALFVVGDSDRYLVNYAFWTKMGLIVLAGLNTAYFVRRIKPQMDRGVTSQNLTNGAKTVAWLSLTLWTCVIILGRFIPYVEDL